MGNRVPGHTVVVVAVGDDGPPAPTEPVNDSAQTPDAGRAGGDRVDRSSTQERMTDQVNLSFWHGGGCPGRAGRQKAF